MSRWVPGRSDHETNELRGTVMRRIADEMPGAAEAFGRPPM
ncbi:hypothetical protein [Nocardia cyriacigeorgica]|nr:hypothetical protein [Nocardia cyriacigeorgica]